MNTITLLWIFVLVCIIVMIVFGWKILLKVLDVVFDILD